ncbi:hypothetical protein GLGCALEP_03616 [Pseudomonas sp. MM221]|nr:hypothetical protein DBADOPDK_03536 [Pseudomonas sp. MM223]CAI3804950.1 hypothetical protein GLGCALEP_03616 [Pseudomonas sp. MM221]
MRVSLEGLGQAVDGDVTTTGATCIATGAGYLDEGRMVLRGRYVVRGFCGWYCRNGRSGVWDSTGRSGRGRG